MLKNLYKLRLPVLNDINELSNKGIIIDTETPRCNRAKLNTGTFCNYNCEFCYYKDQLDKKTSLDIVKKRADYLRQYGITQVDLSGGESSISSDWFEILDYCNSRFEHISCLTHGGRFSNIEFMRESKEHGLKEIMFSLHGATEETHDSITDRKGSFKRILEAIKNAQELGIIVRINSTIYYKNYQELILYSKLINEIKPFEVNFITMNYWEDVDVRSVVGYKELTTEIKKAIDILNKDIIINVRYVPFCYMVGYEKYVCSQYQHIYDLYDWNKEVYKETIDVNKQYTYQEKLNFAHQECAEQRVRFYKKDIKCISCKYFYICDGIEKEIVQYDVHPVEGEKITNVVHFRKNHFK
jgi:MoaA/NifB/PqqE/SkfB family radical SAM enzyme